MNNLTRISFLENINLWKLLCSNNKRYKKKKIKTSNNVQLFIS